MSVADSVAGGWDMSGHSFLLVCVTSYINCSGFNFQPRLSS